MGKEKIIEKTTENLTSINSSPDLLFKIVPLIIGLICLAFCYILFKKIQSTSNQKEYIAKLEKQINTNTKEQTELNLVNEKKFNAIMSQVNQVTYLLQNNINREPNTQISPSKEQKDENIKPKNDNIKQPVQREFMPTSVIGNFPINNKTELPPPINTTNRKEINSNVDISDKQQSGKKIIDLQTLKEEVIIEDASSDDEN